MQILNINSYYYSSTVHRQLQEALLESQINSYTYVPVSKRYVTREECIYDKDEYGRLKKVECYNSIDRYFFHIKHTKILKNIIKEINIKEYNLLHAHSLFSNGYIAMRLKQRYGIPYIVAVRNTDINTFFKRMIHLRKLGRNILLNSDAIVFLSKPYKENLIARYIKDDEKEIIVSKSYVIPNGVNEFWLKNINTPKQLESKEDIRLLHVGAVSKRKNILKTIEAIKILIEKGYNAEFTIIGKIYDARIYNKVKKYDFVKYVTPKPHNELIKFYRENDIFVMPSITETFGLVYLEAMSQGLPVIYTKEQGFDGQFDEGTVGFSVDCFDAKDIANRIIDIIDNYEMLSNNCIRNVNRFGWKNIAQKYNDLYTKVLTKG
jgi:glycosyltransferase involved in cell wall biosynthesis